jgi:hypothetical protein
MEQGESTHTLVLTIKMQKLEKLLSLENITSNLVSEVLN